MRVFAGLLVYLAIAATLLGTLVDAALRLAAPDPAATSKPASRPPAARRRPQRSEARAPTLPVYASEQHIARGVDQPNEEETMSDDKANRGQPDRSKIDMSDDSEVRYWTKHLGISREELQRVVDKVGNAAAAVRKQIAA
jgi:hypothetical protein